MTKHQVVGLIDAYWIQLSPLHVRQVATNESKLKIGRYVRRNADAE